MERREAVQYISLLLGGTIVGANAFLTGCTPGPKSTAAKFDPEHIALLDEVGETILPTTAGSPGAKAAGVGAFMSVMVRDCYDEGQQKAFLEGLSTLAFKASKAKVSKSFMEASPAERKTVLTALDAEQKEYQKNKKEDAPSHYFRMMKELTLLGFFTSKIGQTQALRYKETPGKWEPDVPYVKGEKAWA